MEQTEESEGIWIILTAYKFEVYQAVYSLLIFSYSER